MKFNNEIPDEAIGQRIHYNGLCNQKPVMFGTRSPFHSLFADLHSSATIYQYSIALSTGNFHGGFEVFIDRGHVYICILEHPAKKEMLFDEREFGGFCSNNRHEEIRGKSKNKSVPAATILF